MKAFIFLSYTLFCIFLGIVSTLNVKMQVLVRIFSLFCFIVILLTSVTPTFSIHFVFLQWYIVSVSYLVPPPPWCVQILYEGTILILFWNAVIFSNIDVCLSLKTSTKTLPVNPYLEKLNIKHATPYQRHLKKYNATAIEMNLLSSDSRILRVIASHSGCRYIISIGLQITLG